MKPFKLLLVFLISISSIICISQTSKSRIEITQASVGQEATSIWRTINDIAFFEKQGYAIHLPKDSLIDSLIVKSKKGVFGNEDFPGIYTFVESKVFNQNNYKQAIEKVESQIDLMNNLINEIDSKKDQWDWKFKMFDKYKLIFTLYGTGGSYSPDEGTITLLTNEEGGFMNYEEPANTIIHEITHIGMEYSIVQKHKLSHALKERLVDTFVYLMFKEELPEYTIQNMGNTKIDKYIKKEKDIGSLNGIMLEFLNE
ncbi:hypothetical protein [Marinifilum flexuosum]|uniref:Uncharacterized protein n=1 Tax=Marinifilum flexuosum TaxID=1117708 RepID=A0A419XAY6_9BACT|nr:hypothetical protein [Marinifilum flexuosum]RKE04875.1 hypothetical protein BXY64_1906 [Marinifilum flexuosum]